jgi:Tol biopolymer transport system component
MADEQLPGAEEQQNPDAAPAPAPAPEAAPEEAPVEETRSWGGALLGLAVLAVLLTLVGVYGQIQKQPNHLPLGLGLLVWGVVDLLAQARGLVTWRGAKAVVGNTVNLLRGIALLGLGVWLCLMAAAVIKPVGTATVSTAGVVLLGAYLGTALALEILVKGVRLSGQAFLLASLALIILSYLYFAVPFTYAWAAVFAALAFISAAWALYAGALEESPDITKAVLLAVVVLALPFSVYTVQQMFFTEEQGLFTPTLLVPRMRQVVGDLGEDAGQVTWAPVHTQPGQPGDVPFSDKIAFTDWRDDKPGIGLFLQQDDGKGQLAWLETGEDARITGFSPDGKVLALTQVRKGAEAPSLAVLEPVSPEELAAARLAADAAEAAEEAQDKDAKGKSAKDKAKDKHDAKRKAAAAAAVDLAPYRMKTLYSASVEEGPEHGQVWREMSKELYFAGPKGSLRDGNSTIMRADLRDRQVTPLRQGRGLPAASPDGASLLSVGFSPNEHYLEMADGALGEKEPRHFDHTREKRYFPAWNSVQTRVLFIGSDGKLMIMNSNGTNKRPFDPSDVDGKVWHSESMMPFTLKFKDTGDRYRIWRSKPDGSGEVLVYETFARFISAPQWSPDSKRVAFIIDDGENSSILTVGADGSWPRRFFTTPDSLSELKWSPNSQRLAWICERHAEGSSEVWTAGTEGLDPVKAAESHGRLSSLCWSPQNGHVAVQETTDWRFLGLRLIKPDINNVLMIDLAEKKARYMTRYGLMARQPAFSPQGVALAYFTDQRPWHPGLLRERSSALVISQLF